ncbi:NADPH-dependent conjugated polyketone reductase C2 [Sparassis crispa]|uniref:NADPH-dependent conjugated polyketone reductase C2 n=1 Tax=Sparassis crispa TaxID=139825 RepID=A0A401GEE7_9APHY|nr:NADPH-dependent conjugated polyketone reductase C2 [Sparassis crispa]GBE80564.1 NADPH-dependent conjugated polyketone reductase C2 [Sparassis crispa]
MASCKIIYGTAWKRERTTALVVSAVLNGFRAIDTAAQLKHYREDLVGEALRILQMEHNIKREDLFVQTKYTSIGGQDHSQPLPYNPSDSVAKQVESSVMQSLANLGTSYVDSVLLHSPLDTMPHTLAAWRALMALQDSGKVKEIGICNTYDVRILKMLEEGSGRRVQIVQNRWFEGNYWDQDVCRYCRENDIQYQSFWTLSGSPNLLADASIQTIARAKGYTPAQVLFRLAQLHGITPLSGTTNERHMKEDADVENVDIRLEDENDGQVKAAVDDIRKLVWRL